MARLCNAPYCDLSIDLPDLAGWNVAFKRLDTAKNVTVSNLRVLRRTITRCDAHAQPDYLGLGSIVYQGTDVVIVVADSGQRHIANLNLRSRHDGPSFLLGFAAGSLRCPLVFVLGLLLLFPLCCIFASFFARPEITNRA